MNSFGDHELHDKLIGKIGRHPWVAAIVTASGTRVAGHGIDLGDTVEIGSISKGITGLLYSDAVQRGEISPSDPVKKHLPLDDTPAGDVTLESLSTHTSGLPSLPSRRLAIRRTATWLTRQANPYGDSLEELLSQIRDTSVRSPKPRYSNIGFQLLGHATAAAAGTSYASLVEDRIARPLGLTTLTVPVGPNDVGPRAVTGRSRFGRVSDPWTGEAVGPAGGIRMSVNDLAALGSALLSGQAPGMNALDPVVKFVGPVRIGAAWLTSPGPHGLITWHNGATGGFRSWIGLDREAHSCVAMVNARATSPDRAGFRLLSDLS